MHIHTETKRDATTTGRFVTIIQGLIERLEEERQMRFPRLLVVFENLRITLPPKSDGEHSTAFPEALLTVSTRLAETSMTSGLLSASLSSGTVSTEDQAFDELWSGLLHLYGWNLVGSLPDEYKRILRAVQQLQKQTSVTSDGWVRAIDVPIVGTEEVRRILEGLYACGFLKRSDSAFGAYRYKLSLWVEPNVS